MEVEISIWWAWVRYVEGRIRNGEQQKPDRTGAKGCVRTYVLIIPQMGMVWGNECGVKRLTIGEMWKRINNKTRIKDYGLMTAPAMKRLLTIAFE